MSTTRIERIIDLITELLLVLGEDVGREGLAGTPARVARFWEEFLFYQDYNTETIFEAVTADQMIVVNNICGWSLCEHHLLPFSFEASVGYVSGSKILGLSKIPRIVKQASHALHNQERLANQIADAIEAACEPKGVGVIIKGQHTCMQMRGIEAREASMTTSCMRGVLLANPVAREEFLRLCTL